MFDDDKAIDELFNGNKGPKGFAPLKPGDPAVGGIVFKMERTEERNIAGEIVYYENSTTPKPCLVTWHITSQRDPENPDDDGVRRIWWTGNPFYELRQTIKNGGFGKPKLGGELWKKCIGEKPSGKGNAMKLHAVKYVPPTPEALAKAAEFAEKYAKKAAQEDDWFSGGGDSFSGQAQQSAKPATTLDSMRSSFDNDAPPF